MSYFSEQEICSDIFAVPAGEYLKLPERHLYLIYAPLAGQSMIADEAMFSRLTAALQGAAPDQESAETASALHVRNLPRPLPESPEEYANCIIIPTARCNFSCRYCFAAQGHSSEVLDRRRLIAALDFLLKTPQEKYHVLFSGGGEPLLEKDLLKQAVMYLESRIGKERFSVTVNTNGSLLDRQTAAFFREYPIHPAVSFDVLRNIQEQTRGHYEKVRDNIKMLLSENIVPSIISTVTEDTAKYLPAMAEELVTGYPQIKYWTAEIATLPHLTPAEMALFHQVWLDSYFAARQIYSGSGRSLDCDFEKMMTSPRFRRCRGKMVITPSGTVTVCPLTTAPADRLWHGEQYGWISPDGVWNIDHKKFFSLTHDADISRRKCRSCFMKWNCAGGCHNQNNLFDPEIRELYCRSAREFGMRWLIGKISETVEKQSHCTLVEYLYKQLSGERDAADE